MHLANDLGRELVGAWAIGFMPPVVPQCASWLRSSRDNAQRSHSMLVEVDAVITSKPLLARN